MDEHDLHRLTRNLVADPVIAAAPVVELERRAASRARHRSAAVAIFIVVLLAASGTALARAARPEPARVGTSPTTANSLPDLRVYLYAADTPAQIEAVRSALLADPGAHTVLYQDQATAYRRFQCLFAGQPDLLDAVRQTELPSRFDVDVTGGQAEIDRLATALGHHPAVETLVAYNGYVVPPSATTTTGQAAPMTAPDATLPAQIGAGAPSGTGAQSTSPTVLGPPLRCPDPVVRLRG